MPYSTNSRLSLRPRRATPEYPAAPSGLNEVDVFQEVSQRVRQFDGAVRDGVAECLVRLAVVGEMAHDGLPQVVVTHGRRLMVLGVARTDPHLEERQPGRRGPVAGHVFKDCPVHRVQAHLQESVRSAPNERELRSPCMSPHEKNEGLLGGVSHRHTVLGGNSELLEGDFGITLINEVGEVFPDESGKGIAQFGGGHGLRGVKFPGGVVGVHQWCGHNLYVGRVQHFNSNSPGGGVKHSERQPWQSGLAETKEIPPLNVPPVRLRTSFFASRSRLRSAFVLAAAATLAACSAGPSELPDPRPLVIQSGARLSVSDMARMREVYDDVNHQLQVIAQDPSFWIITNTDSRDVYPWETLELAPDTARIQYQRTAPDLRGTYEIYAHLHLMSAQGRLDDWLPDHTQAEGWELERAIMRKVADSWLLGRAVFDLAPYGLMDEIIYAYEAGTLDGLLLNLRPVEFAEARDAWLADNPNADREFRQWYRDTFDREPPGPPTDAAPLSRR